jgi:uncharacterized membrane protein YoaK (UPF0700 family)
MHDRVVDRAAAHASPTQLTVRDWLLVALSFSSGIYEAVIFLSFGKVFTAFQTGNIVFLGLGVAGTRPPAGPNPVTVVVSLAAFAAGAALAMQILKWFDGDQEVADKDVFHVWPRRVSITLGATLLLQCGFLAGWTATSSPASLTYLLVALAAFAAGLQMNAIRSLHVPGISTTAVTATFIALASGVATWSLTAREASRLTMTLVSMAAGAFLGDWMLGHAHHFVPVVPVIVTAAVIWVASAVLREQRGPRPAAVAHVLPSQVQQVMKRVARSS